MGEEKSSIVYQNTKRLLEPLLNHAKECSKNRTPCYNVSMMCYLSLHMLTETPMDSDEKDC